MLNHFYKSYKFYLLLLLLFFVCTDQQSYKILYGEDATWINNFLNGDIYKSLFPRDNFLVLGASLPQVICLSIAKNLSHFAILKSLLSYCLIFLISISNLFNNFLNRKIRFLLAVFCFVPLTKSIDFEVFGHLHNLVWYYPLLTINLLCYIFHYLINNRYQEKTASYKFFNLIFFSFFLTSFLFPICAIFVLLSQIFFLFIKTNYLDKKLFIKNKIIIYSFIITLLFYLLNVEDRGGSIIEENIDNLNILKYLEFFIRVFNEPFTSLFTHHNYLGFYFLMISAVLTIFTLNSFLYLDTFLVCFKYLLKRKKPDLTIEIVNLFLLILIIINTIIFSYSRFPELSYFISGLTNSAYPERYYLYQNQINAVIIFTILTNTINGQYLKKSINKVNIYFGKFSKYSFFRIQKKLFTYILFISIIISIISRLGNFLLIESDKNRYFYSSCDIDEKNIYVDGFPKEFKTVIPKESIYFKKALDNCKFDKN